MEEQNSPAWQPPPPPEKIEAPEAAEMSEAATLGSIFFEPGRTFEDLRRKPRFVIAGLIILIVLSIFNFAFIQRLGYERIVRDRMEANPRVQQMPADQKEQIISQQSGPIWKTIGYAAPVIGVALVIFVGGLIYWLGANAVGGSANYLQGVSVWVYSWFPPFVVAMIANFIILYLKAPEDIDIMTSQGGLIHASPSMLIDARAQPVLNALLGSLDLFSIWGWILAAIGLRIVAKISSGAAWAVVLIWALVGVAAKVVGALFFG